MASPALLLACVVLLAPIATRASPSPAGEDIDGDGAPDAVRVVDNTIAVGSKRLLRWKVPPAHSVSRVTAARWDGRVLVTAALQPAGGEEAVSVVLVEKEGALVPLWQGPTGTRASGEVAVSIDATRRGPIRYQTRPDIDRCDGGTAWLLAEGWNPRRRDFERIRSDPFVRADAPTPALAPVGERREGVWFVASPASSIAGVTSADELRRVRELEDGDLETSWEPHGSGRGAFITYRAPGKTATAIALTVVATPSAGRHRLAVVGATSAIWIDLPSKSGAFVVALPQPIDSCVTVILGSEGPEAPRLAELSVLTADDSLPTANHAALVAAVVANGEAAATAQTALRRRGAAAIPAIGQALRTPIPSGARQTLIDILVAANDPAAAAALGQALRDRAVTGAAAASVVRALGRLGAAGERSLIDALPASAEARAHIWPELQRSTTSESTLAIIAAAGTTGRTEHRAFMAALASRPFDQLLEALHAAAEDARTADLARAIDVKVEGDAVTEAQRQGALTAWSRLAKGSHGYATRYRALTALARHGSAANVEDVGAMAVGVFRRAASAGLATNPAAAATNLLTRWVSDPDPGLRIDALLALASRKADLAVNADGAPPAVDAAIAKALATDPWPDVRYEATTALASRCRRPPVASALRLAIESDPHERIRIAALSALASCADARLSSYLLALAADTSQMLALRRHSIGLLASGDASADPQTTERLAVLYRRWRSAAYDNASALALAVATGPALGQRGGRGASRALADAVSDLAFPDIVAGALIGLRLRGDCPAHLAATIRSMTANTHAAIAAAAQQLAPHCR